MMYFRKHWKGELSLAKSFWINYFLLNIALFVLWIILSNFLNLEYPILSARLAIIIVVIVFFIIGPWQIIGLWRSCKNHIKKGKRFWPHVAQVIIVLGIIYFLFSLYICWPLCKITFTAIFRLAFIEGSSNRFTIKLIKDDYIALQGDLDFGVSKELSNVLNDHVGIKGIIIDSYGGKLNEGRKLAEIISDYKLDTYSFERCYSAATIAFIAGKKRYLGVGARLAFHQPTFPDGISSEDFVNYKDEISKYMLKYFRHQGVSKEFTEKIYKTPHNRPWYPTVEEMLEAGVIHGIVNYSDLSPVEYNHKEK